MWQSMVTIRGTISEIRRRKQEKREIRKKEYQKHQQQNLTAGTASMLPANHNNKTYASGMPLFQIICHVSPFCIK